MDIGWSAGVEIRWGIYRISFGLKADRTAVDQRIMDDIRQKLELASAQIYMFGALRGAPKVHAGNQQRSSA